MSFYHCHTGKPGRRPAVVDWLPAAGLFVVTAAGLPAAAFPNFRRCIGHAESFGLRLRLTAAALREAF